MITERINNNLGTIFNTKTDPIYKSIICNRDGNIPDTITKPTDIDIGAIASQIEYLRQLAINLLPQLFINEASGEFLKYQLNEFFDSLRLENETDVEWVERTIAIIFQQKVSRASIIVAMRPYSSREPEITSTVRESAYADFSYADVYVADEVTVSRETAYFLDFSDVLFTDLFLSDTRIDYTTYHVLPAIAENYQSFYYTIKITLYDVNPGSLYSIIALLDQIVAAGITYIIQIEYT